MLCHLELKSVEIFFVGLSFDIDELSVLLRQPLHILLDRFLLSLYLLMVLFILGIDLSFLLLVRFDLILQSSNPAVAVINHCLQGHGQVCLFSYLLFFVLHAHCYSHKFLSGVNLVFLDSFDLDVVE